MTISPRSRIRHIGAVLALCLVSVASHASGDVESLDVFVDEKATDILLDRYGAGDIGITLVSYGRVSLYPAWRAIVLGADRLRTLSATMKKRSRRARSAAWVAIDDPRSAVGQWLRASAAASNRKPAPFKGVVVYDDMQGFVNCPESAFEFATSTLASLRRRSDATPQRISTWIQGQDAVFGFCGLGESKDRFEQIGQTAGHPMQVWGAYLALRSVLREASDDRESTRLNEGATPEVPTGLMEEIESRTQAIVGDPRLAPVHEAARATWRTAQYRFRPMSRFIQLSALLEDPARDPYEGDQLDHWRRLANDFIDKDFSPDGAKIDQEMRETYQYFDWIRTIQGCGPYRNDCPASREHAVERWMQSSKSAAEHRAWLVAALLVLDRLPPEVERAALAVPRTAPEYLTVRDRLARAYLAKKDFAAARTMSDTALAVLHESGSSSVSAANVLKGLRFATATSVSDAVDFLLRTPVQRIDRDTGERDTSPGMPLQPDLDGLMWINTRLSTTDLMALVNDKRLPSDIRLRLAVAVWMRADRLGNAALAAEASRIVEQGGPALAQAVARYRAAPSVDERWHSLAMSSLRLGLSMGLSGYSEDLEKSIVSYGKRGIKNEDLTAGMWCYNEFDEQQPFAGMLSVTSDASLRDTEYKKLKRYQTATTYIGDDVLEHARLHPQDPEVPWLLYMVVQSTRGGCLDSSAHSISKTAHHLLHQRFPKSVWTKNTPYWY